MEKCDDCYEVFNTSNYTRFLKNKTWKNRLKSTKY